MHTERRSQSLAGRGEVPFFRSQTGEMNAGLQLPRVKNATIASLGFARYGSMALSCLLTNPSSTLVVKSLTHSFFLLTLEPAAMYSPHNPWGAANYENYLLCYRSVNCADPSCLHPGTSCHSPDDSVHHHGSRDTTRIQFE